MLLLPGMPGFNEILNSSLPPGTNLSQNFVVSTDTGLFEAVDPKQLAEYVYGGEYTDRLEQMEDEDELDDYYEFEQF